MISKLLGQQDDILLNEFVRISTTDDGETCDDLKITSPV